MLLAQITDLHIKAPGKRAYADVDTAAHLAAAVAHLNALDPRPRLVVASGDLVDTGAPEEYAHLRSLLAPLEIPVALLPGNHDDRAGLRAAFPEHDYLAAGGPYLHYARDLGPIRLVCLDTLREDSHWGALDEPRAAWLEATLAEAPDRPTVVVAHHPPFRTGMAMHDENRLIGRERFAGILRANPQVALLLTGHLHRSMAVPWAGVTALCLSSVAHQALLDLRPGAELAIRMEPPACLLLDWDPTEGFVTHFSPIGAFDGPLAVFDKDGNLID
ncbi:MAG: phosphodiesterase [Pseudomonadota bacterium]